MICRNKYYIVIERELATSDCNTPKDIKFKKRMKKVYGQQVIDLETLVSGLKIASAIIHYDEISPHMHIVGVPIKYKNKNGMSKQVKKYDVFTKESLGIIQKKIEVLSIKPFNKEFNTNFSLKPNPKEETKIFMYQI